MYPAKPPFPCPRNFPFQPLIGIQISTLISESGVGLSVATTRQKAGATLYRCGTFSPAFRSGGENAPAFTLSARVMLTLGNATCLRSAHFCVGAPEPESAPQARVEQEKAADRSRIRGFRIVASLAETQTA